MLIVLTTERQLKCKLLVNKLYLKCPISAKLYQKYFVNKIDMNLM